MTMALSRFAESTSGSRLRLSHAQSDVARCESGNGMNDEAGLRAGVPESAPANLELSLKENFGRCCDEQARCQRWTGGRRCSSWTSWVSDFHASTLTTLIAFLHPA